MAKLNMSSKRCFERRPERLVQGGGRRSVDERRCKLRLGIKEKEAGDDLLTTRMRVDEGLGDKEAETVEIDAGGRRLKTTVATLG
jgi:hypothetical protein